MAHSPPTTYKSSEFLLQITNLIKFHYTGENKKQRSSWKQRTCSGGRDSIVLDEICVSCSFLQAFSWMNGELQSGRMGYECWCTLFCSWFPCSQPEFWGQCAQVFMRCNMLIKQNPRIQNVLRFKMFFRKEDQDDLFSTLFLMPSVCLHTCLNPAFLHVIWIFSDPIINYFQSV